MEGGSDKREARTSLARYGINIRGCSRRGRKRATPKLDDVNCITPGVSGLSPFLPRAEDTAVIGKNDGRLNVGASIVSKLFGARNSRRQFNRRRRGCDVYFSYTACIHGRVRANVIRSLTQRGRNFGIRLP